MMSFYFLKSTKIVLSNNQQNKIYLFSLSFTSVLKQLENEIFNIKQKHADEMEKLKETIEREVRSKITVEKKYKEQLESFEKQISSLNKEVQAKLEDIEKINKELDKQKWYNSSFKEDLEKNKDTINSITKENSELKQQLEKYWIELAECKAKLQNIPDINIEDIQMKEKIAKMKEAKISSLLMKLDNVMSSMESNMSCYS